MSQTISSIIEGLEDFFLQCPLLEEGAFRVDALGDTPNEYAIEPGVFDPVIESYIDGSSDRRYQFNFSSREFYGMDRLQNIANSTFYEKMADWIQAKNRAKDFPEMPSGCHAEEIHAISSGYLFDEAMTNARYQIQMELIYHKEA